jgi:hypothetical protein
MLVEWCLGPTPVLPKFVVVKFIIYFDVFCAVDIEELPAEL